MDFENEKIKEIDKVFDKYPGLNKAWADLLGIDEKDERIYFGWPEKFEYFSKGWIAFFHHHLMDEKEYGKKKPMDEIHDMIQQFSTELPNHRFRKITWQDDILQILNILDKLNDKINAVQRTANSAAKHHTLYAE